jgi:opacity protein-like surface antigen
MKKSVIIMNLFLGLVSTNSMGGTMGPQSQSNWGWVGSVSLGSTWPNGGAIKTFYLTPEIEKTYKANKSSNALFDGELFLGIQKTLPNALQGQLGLAVAATSNAKLSGVIWDDADPRFDNYTYRYKIQHTHVAAKAKILYDQGYWLIPWVSGSIGVGFNDAHSFQNTPIIFEAIPNPNFKSHTQTTFTYTLGAGVQKLINQNWQVGVGYEFADWGKSSLGRAWGQTLNSGLSRNHFYTNGFLFNLTYTSYS